MNMKLLHYMKNYRCLRNSGVEGTVFPWEEHTSDYPVPRGLTLRTGTYKQVIQTE